VDVQDHRCFSLSQFSGLYPPLFHACGRGSDCVAEGKENRNVRWKPSLRVEGTGALRYSWVSYLIFRSSPIRIYGYCDCCDCIAVIPPSGRSTTVPHGVIKCVRNWPTLPARSCVVTHACFLERSGCLECFLPILLSLTDFPLTLKEVLTSGWFYFFPDINIIF